MGPVAILFLQKLKFSTLFILYVDILLRITKIDENPHISRGGNDTFMKSKLEAPIIFWSHVIFINVSQFVVLLCAYVQNLSQIPQSRAK